MRSFDPARPFTRKRGFAAGITRRELEGPSYRRLLFGIYVLASVPDTPALRAEAALLVAGPRARTSHLTAARRTHSDPAGRTRHGPRSRRAGEAHRHPLPCRRVRKPSADRGSGDFEA